MDARLETLINRHSWGDTRGAAVAIDDCVARLAEVLTPELFILERDWPAWLDGREGDEFSIDPQSLDDGTGRCSPPRSSTTWPSTGTAAPTPPRGRCAASSRRSKRTSRTLKPAKAEQHLRQRFQAKGSNQMTEPQPRDHLPVDWTGDIAELVGLDDQGRGRRALLLSTDCGAADARARFAGENGEQAKVPQLRLSRSPGKGRSPSRPFRFRGISPEPASADESSGDCGMDEFRIGDLVSLDGRTFRVRGFDPMSLPEQTVGLVDTATGARTRLPLARLAAARLIRADAASWPQRARRGRGDAIPGGDRRGVDEGEESV